MSRESEATAQLAPCPHCGKHHDEDLLRCPSTDMMLPLEGRRLDGKFRFLSALGSGGMASVYLAVNERVDREVAIKFLRPEIGRDGEAVARFRSEAKAAGRIGNVHICEILDLGESPIGPYIVMERLRGIDLAALIRRQTRLAPGYAVRIVRHALEGLAAAHEAGIVHRDLKPGNVFLHRTDSGETIVKLMDFGVSKFLDGSGEAETASGILLGTPEYMAPEQLEGAHKIGPSADIWAMGAILYRAITGHQVFSGPNLAAVLRSMAVDEVRELSRLVGGVPPELEAVIHRCLQRDPAARYPSARALSEALAPFEEVEAEVIPLAQQPGRTLDVPISELEPVGDAGPADAPSEHATQIWEEPSKAAASKLAPVGAAPVEAAAVEAAAVEAAAVEGGVEAAAVEAEAQPVERKRKGGWIAAGLLLIAAAAWGGVTALDLRGERDHDPTASTASDPTGEEQSGEAQSGDEQQSGDETKALASADSEPVTSETGEGQHAGEPESEDESEGESEGEFEGEGETAAVPEADESEAETEAETEQDNSPGLVTDRPPPAGTFRNGSYISPITPGPLVDLAGAKRECEGLAQKRFADVGDWALANPVQLRKFIGNSQIKRSRYWTTALHAGRALVFSLPQGKKSSEKADRKLARALCVAKY